MNFKKQAGAVLPTDYREFLEDLKAHIQTAQVKASLSVNRELIHLYWQIGGSIVERQRKHGWGKAIVELLSADLSKEFPGISGFSPANIWRMRAFYLAWSKELPAQPARESGNPKLAQPARELDGEDLPNPAAEIPWFHNVILIEKLKDPAERLWYAQQTVENGWSRNVLVHQIELGLFHNKGKAQTNFRRTLPQTQSDLAQEVVKDPYAFDFLGLDARARERDLELGLLEHIQKFLLELGVGFAFVGRQVPLEVGGEDFYLDLLFYHLRLRCYVVIELKTGPFKPEYAGKMNFYLSAVDDRLRQPGDKPSIGIILCKSKNHLIVEYALRDAHKPIGVSAYKLTKALPEKLKGTLPTIKELEKEFSTGKGGEAATESTIRKFRMAQVGGNSQGQKAARAAGSKAKKRLTKRGKGDGRRGHGR